MKKTYAIILMAVVLGISGLLAIWLGQDGSWDLANYHFYNPFSLINGRLGFDINPAQLQNYFNPFFDLPFYWLVTNFSPKVVTFWIGAFQGVNVILLFFISRELLKGAFPKRLTFVLSSLVAIIGFIGPSSIAEHGMTFNDNTNSIFILASFLVTLRAHSERDKSRSYFVLLLAAGSFIGLALGFKLTALLYIPSLFIAILFLSSHQKRILRSLLSWSAGLLLGFLISNGYWAYKLWHTFGNPVFPLFNGIFKSEYFPAHNFGSAWLPESLTEYIFWPFKLATLDTTGLAWQIRDNKLAIVYVLGAIVLLLWLYRKFISKRQRVDAESIKVKLLYIFVGGAYLMWLTQSGHYRYLHTVEILAPLIVMLLLINILDSKRKRTVAALWIALMAFAMTMIFIPNFGRVPWSESFFGIDPPKIKSDDTMVIMIGGHPSAHVIPFFSPQVRFVRAESNFNTNEEDIRARGPTPAMLDYIQGAIDEHTGNFYGLARLDDETSSYADFGFKVVKDTCQDFSTKLSRVDFQICELTR